jgi:hypothetical protein
MDSCDDDTNHSNGIDDSDGLVGWRTANFVPPHMQRSELKKHTSSVNQLMPRPTSKTAAASMREKGDEYDRDGSESESESTVDVSAAQHNSFKIVGGSIGRARGAASLPEAHLDLAQPIFVNFKKGVNRHKM